MADEPSREFMVRAGGVNFHVVEWGDPRNPPVLLLHGRSANAISWHRLATDLADGYRVVAFDQRGHGLSDWPGRYSDRLLVADVVRVVEALALGRFALIGHSMGAAIAWEYAARNSDTVRCLILLDASPDPPGEIEAYVAGAPTPPGLASPDDIVEWATAQGWTDGVDGGDLDRWLARHARRSPDGAGFGDSTRRATRMRTRAGACGRATARIGGTSPRLAAQRSSSLARRVQSGRSSASWCPSGLIMGRSRVIPDCGHLVHWQNLRATLTAVRPFLDACRT